MAETCVSGKPTAVLFTLKITAVGSYETTLRHISHRILELLRNLTFLSCNVTSELCIVYCYLLHFMAIYQQLGFILQQF